MLVAVFIFVYLQKRTKTHIRWSVCPLSRCYKQEHTHLHPSGHWQAPELHPTRMWSAINTSDHMSSRPDDSRPHQGPILQPEHRTLSAKLLHLETEDNLSKSLFLLSHGSKTSSSSFTSSWSQTCYLSSQGITSVSTPILRAAA